MRFLKKNEVSYVVSGSTDLLLVIIKLDSYLWEPKQTREML